MNGPDAAPDYTGGYAASDSTSPDKRGVATAPISVRESEAASVVPGGSGCASVAEAPPAACNRDWRECVDPRCGEGVCVQSGAREFDQSAADKRNKVKVADAAYDCGWCFGTGVHHYNTDDMDRLTMPCPNRDCPKSPDWWHAAAEANAEDEAWEKRSRTRDQ